MQSTKKGGEVKETKVINRHQTLVRQIYSWKEKCRLSGSLFCAEFCRVSQRLSDVTLNSDPSHNPYMTLLLLLNSTEVEKMINQSWDCRKLKISPLSLLSEAGVVQGYSIKYSILSLSKFPSVLIPSFSGS